MDVLGENWGGSKEKNTNHANTSSLPLLWDFQSNIHTELHTKSYTFYYCPRLCENIPTQGMYSAQAEYMEIYKQRV